VYVFLYPFLTDNFGSDLTADNYKNFWAPARRRSSGSSDRPVGAPRPHLRLQPHVPDPRGRARCGPDRDGAAEAAEYENLGPGPWTTSSSVRWLRVPARFRTLIDGFDLFNLRGNYATLAGLPVLPGTDVGRINWFDDVVAGHFQICVRRGPIVAVGDLPGPNGSRFANANLGSFPNPAFAAAT
jgi:hypothetical protein